MAKKPNYPLRQAAAAAVLGGPVGSALSVARDTDKSFVPKMVEQYVDNPEHPGNSILTHTTKMVPPEAVSQQHIVQNALEAFPKTALAAGTAVLAYHGAKKLYGLLSGAQHNR